MPKINWTNALAARGQWVGVGNIRKIYEPCRLLLKRWQVAYQAAYNLRKRPNLTEAVTHALVLCHSLLVKECVKLEKITSEREQAARAMDLEQTKQCCPTQAYPEDCTYPDCDCAADNETKSITSKIEKA